MRGVKFGESEDVDVEADEGDTDELIVEIQISDLNFNGVKSRLIVIRNVTYIVEQQRLLTRSIYDRKLTDTLSHELITPLNCIINLSERLKTDFSNKLQALDEKLKRRQSDAELGNDNRTIAGQESSKPTLGKKHAEKKKNTEFCEFIWSSSKMLEFLIRSIISRQQFEDESTTLRQSSKSASEIEASIRKVLAPFSLQMSQAGINLEFSNKIAQDN